MQTVIHIKKFLSHTATLKKRRGMIFSVISLTVPALALTIFTLGIGSLYLSKGAYAEGTSLDFTIDVDPTPVLEIILVNGNSSTLKITPSMEFAGFNSVDVPVKVGTSNLTGYTLSMNTNSTSLVSGDNSIPTLATGSTYYCTSTLSSTGSDECTFTPNTWGYRLSTDAADTYKAIPSGTELFSTSAPSNGITTTLSFGSRINAQQPAGQYSTTINFVAVANPVQYIQNLDGTTCTAATPLTVLDARDYQEYTVQRLADGKCWMTKNLNLAGGTKLTSTDTNIPAGYVLPTANGFQPGNRLPNSYNGEGSFSKDDMAYVYNSGNLTDNCATPGCYSYYSWIAATAGSGVDITTDNTDAPYDICPAGWKLPSTRTGTDSTSDFRALMIAYGGSSSIATYNESTNPTGATMYGKITASPVPNFLLTGYYAGGSFTNGESFGVYWSSTLSDNVRRARGLSFTPTNVYSINHGVLRRGFAIRCLLAE